MKRKDLRNGDIIITDNSWIGDHRPEVWYVVMENVGGYNRVAVAFKGNVNCEVRPSGWYDLTNGENDLPFDVIKVYRPRFFGNMFRGDFENDEEYELIYEGEN